MLIRRVLMVFGLSLVLVWLPYVATANAATLVVTSNADSGPGTLRDALATANSDGVPDTITFAGDMMIYPAYPYTFTEDGTTVDASGHQVTLDNDLNYGPVAACFFVTSSGDTFKGLCVINSGPPDNQWISAFELAGGRHNNTVAGCTLGLDLSGASRGNMYGIYIADQSNDVIGGPSAADRNIISSNMNGIVIGPTSNGNTIEGNFIGTDASGNLDRGNYISIGGGGIGGAGINVRGDQNVVRDNLVSGTHATDIAVGGTNSSIVGNLIGLNASGTSVISNSTVVGISCNSGSTTIGGPTPVERNVVSGLQTGIVLQGCSGVNVWGNYLGTDSTGTRADSGSGRIFANTIALSLVSVTNTTVGPGNLISGNGTGISLDSGCTGIHIEGNLLGTDTSGQTPLGHQGTDIQVQGSNNSVGGEGYGQSNTITGASEGVCVQGGSGNTMGANAIFGNSALGIDLEPLGQANVPQSDYPYPTSGKGNLQMNFPVITGAIDTVSGFKVQGTAEPSSTIRLFTVDGGPGAYGQGKRYLGSSVCSPTGSWLIQPTAGSDYLTATATDQAGNTSEFSLNAPVADKVGPVGSVVINSGAATSTKSKVTLSLSVSDVVSTTNQITMMVSNNSDFAGAPWVSFVSRQAWALLSGSGNRTVYVKYRDKAGNIGPVVNATIKVKEGFSAPMPTTYYLAEGYVLHTSNSWYDTYILIVNPSDQATTVTCTFMLNYGQQKEFSTTIAARSRCTLNLEDRPINLINTEVSTKVTCKDGIALGVSRSMYFSDNGRSGSTGSIATGSPSKKWYFAEGTYRPGFDTYLCFQNPNDNNADVKITYFKGDGTVRPQDIIVGAHSRYTVTPRNVLGTGKDSALDFSSYISSNYPIVAERPVYFAYTGDSGVGTIKGGHDSMGSTTAATKWYLPEGCSASKSTTGMYYDDTFILLQNPNTVACNVTCSFMQESGKQVSPKSITIPASSRYTVKLNDSFPGSFTSVATEITSNLSIIAERSSYFIYRVRVGNVIVREGTNSMGSTDIYPSWFIPEGAEGQLGANRFWTYVLVQNPNSVPARCDFSLLTDIGQTINRACYIPANSRYTLDLGNVPDLQSHSVATRVDADSPVAVEQVTYSQYKGITGGESSVGIGGKFDQLKLHKMVGISVSGSATSTRYLKNDYHASYFGDDPSTAGDEGLLAKQTNFKNVQIYVPYDEFLDPYTASGQKMYDKIIFEDLRNYNTKSICVVFTKRANMPTAKWPGWGKKIDGTNDVLVQNPTDPNAPSPSLAEYAVSLDLDNWETAIQRFCQRYGSKVKYYEIWDEPGFDYIQYKQRKQKDKNDQSAKCFFCGSCESDYPNVLKVARDTIRSTMSTYWPSTPQPVVISGSLLSDVPSAPVYGWNSYNYYRDIGKRLECDAIGIHLFQPPYDTTMSKHNDDPNVWQNAYNYLRYNVFGVDFPKPIFVTSCGWCWATQAGLGFNPVLTANTNWWPDEAVDAIEWHSPFLSGLDGLLYNTTCPKVWYFNDVGLGGSNWNTASYPGNYYCLGLTIDKDWPKGVDPEHPPAYAPPGQPIDYQALDHWTETTNIPYRKKPLWNEFVKWMKVTDNTL